MSDGLLVFTLVVDYRPSTKVIAELPAPKSVFDGMKRSFREAISEEPGNVYVELFQGRELVSDPFLLELDDAVDFLRKDLKQPEQIWSRCYDYDPNAHKH